jgi:hypothetical protein
MNRPLRSSSLKCSQLAQLGTRLELAISTRGALAWVLEHAHGLARLNEQGLVFVQVFQRSQDLVKASPVARGAANAAVHHQALRVLGHFGVEVVLHHAVSGFGDPVFTGQLLPRGARTTRVGSRRGSMEGVMWAP